MLENSKSQRPEQSAEFASAWLSHRLESAELHSTILYPKIIELLHSASGSVIADYGCGAGDLTIELLTVLKPSRLIAIDINQHLLECCQLACQDSVEVLCQDVAKV